MVQQVSEKISEMDLAAVQTAATYVPVTMGSDSYRMPYVHPGYSVAASGAGLDDTAAIQSAVDTANAQYVVSGIPQVVRFAPGLYGICPRELKYWDIPLYNAGTTEVHVGVILRSGVILECTGATFTPIPPAGAQAGWYYAMFGCSALNMTVGTLEKIRISNARFEVLDSTWSQAYFTVYGCLLVGVDGFTLDKCSMDNDARATAIGRLARVMNSHNVRMTDFYCRKLSQCFYVNYIDGLTVTGYAESFGEVLDIDSYCRNVYANVSCRDGSGNERGQCFDISAVVNGEFHCRCDNIGNVAIIYPKPDSPGTFAEWVADFPTGTFATNPVIPENIYLEVEGTDVYNHVTSDGYRAIQVGINRDDSSYSNYWDGKGVSRGVTIRAKLLRSDPVLVYECENLDLDLHVRTAYCGATDRINNAALMLRQARGDATKIAESRTTGRARVYVENSEKTGVRCSNVTSFHLEATVKGYNTSASTGSAESSGIFIEGLAKKASELTIQNLRCSDGHLDIGAGVDPADLRLSWDGGEATNRTYVQDMGGHRFASGGTSPVATGSVVASSLAWSGEERISFDTTTGDKSIILGPARAPGGMALAAFVTNEAAVTGNAVNYTRLSLRRIRAGAIGSTIGNTINYDAANVAAGTTVQLDVTSDADGVFLDGDLVAVQATQTAAGSAQVNIWVRWKLVEHAL